MKIKAKTLKEAIKKIQESEKRKKLPALKLKTKSFKFDREKVFIDTNVLKIINPFKK